MYLKVVRGLEQAKKELASVGPLDMKTVTSSMVDKSEEVFGEKLSPQEWVQQILEDVRLQGDEALHRYTALLDGKELDSLEVPKDQIQKALDTIPPSLTEALKLAARRIEKFHRATMRQSWLDPSAGLGELVMPLEQVGIYAPGGTASYPSTVLMATIPARVAGVKQIYLCTPTTDSGLPSAAVLAACSIAGVDRVFQVGGVQAIGALAFGTETIPRVDKICGPGNFYVTLAKKLVYGNVGIDGLYGPTETVIVADDTADASLCAADLLAQAEHDALACPILITTFLPLIGDVEGELEKQLQKLEREETIISALRGRGRMVLVDTLDEAMELANMVAPEHLCLMVKEPWTWVGKARHAGGVFLGPFSPEVIGDYVAGPSHVMPTGGTARFSSTLSVHHFLKTVPVVGIKPEEYQELAEAAALIARSEGLTAHARALEIRLSESTSSEDDKSGN